MQLSRWTIALCVDCSFPVVGAHDCQRQIAENEPMSTLGRIVFVTLRGELIARLHKARQ